MIAFLFALTTVMLALEFQMKVLNKTKAREAFITGPTGIPLNYYQVKMTLIGVAISSFQAIYQEKREQRGDPEIQRWMQKNIVRSIKNSEKEFANSTQLNEGERRNLLELGIEVVDAADSLLFYADYLNMHLKDLKLAEDLKLKQLKGYLTQKDSLLLQKIDVDATKLRLETIERKLSVYRDLLTWRSNFVNEETLPPTPLNSVISIFDLQYYLLNYIINPLSLEGKYLLAGGCLQLIIINCIFNIIIARYGDYILTQYPIEECYPKLASFIKNRVSYQKLLIRVSFI